MHMCGHIWCELCGGQRLTSSVFLDLCLPYLLKLDLSINTKLMPFSLASWAALRILPPLLSLKSAGITGMHPICLAFPCMLWT